MRKNLYHLADYRKETDLVSAPLSFSGIGGATPRSCFRVTSQVSCRVFAPLYLAQRASDAFVPLSRKNVAEAVYENAIRFLDKIQYEENAFDVL